MVQQKKFDTVCFIYLTVDHTKFSPDRLLSSVAKTFYKSDVFFIEMLFSIVQQYAMTHMCLPQVIYNNKGLLFYF